MADTPEPTTAQMRAWQAFLAAHSRVVGVLGRELEEGPGLPLSWYEVLLKLREAEGGRLRMNELADSLLLSRSAATRFVDRMESAGLVRRTACPSDRRGTFVEATPQGEARFEEAAPLHVEGVSRHFTDQISADEAEVLAAAFERVLAGLQEA